MGLAAKFFLAASLMILAVMVVAGRDLQVVRHLVEVHRAIVTRTVPAVQTEATLQQSLQRLLHLQTRYFILHDWRYADLWTARAHEFTGMLDRLSPYLTTSDERKQLAKLRAAFERYGRLVAHQFERPVRGKVFTARGREVERAAARVEHTLVRLTETTTAAAERSQRDALLLEERTWKAVLITIGGSVLATMVAAWLLAYRMTRAIRRLSAATAEMAQGSFTGPIEVSSRDEIGELAQAFDRMAARLSEVDRLKHEFFSHISHELRTPLAATQEAVHLLDDRVVGPLEPKQARLVEIIRASTGRMLRLVDRILELSRLRAGLLRVDRRWVDVETVIGRAVQELLPQAEARGLAVQRNGTGVGVRVWGDSERLLELLVNLIGNAIKYTPPGGSVGVRVAQATDWVEIVVEDTGIGIPADALPSIFDPYYQARDARGGTGLGLAIVKGIVEAHGGRVHAESREGKGSRFTVTLPRRAGAAP